MEQVPLEEFAHDEPDATGVVHVRRGVAATGPHVGDDGRPVRDFAELVNRQWNPELVGNGKEMQHAVGGSTGRRDRGDRVFDRAAGDDV